MNDFEKIKELAEQKLALHEEIETIEVQLKNRLDKLKALEEIEIPEALGGLNGVKLSNGMELSVESDYYKNGTGFVIDEGLEYLRQRGDLSMVKRSVIIEAGLDVPEEKVTELNAFLEELGLPCEQKFGINPQSLKAYAREKERDGESIPLDVFRLYKKKAAVLKNGARKVKPKRLFTSK